MVENEQKSNNPAASYKVGHRRSDSKVGKYIAIIILVLIGSFAAGLVGGYVSLRLAGNSPLVNRTAVTDGNTVVSQEEEDISSVASKVGPSVVSIRTEERMQSYLGPQTFEGAGSGIIISSDGLILTNKHVVSGSSQLTVTTSDGTSYENAQVLGTDPLNDLAFVKLKDAKDLTPAVLGDSSSVRIGQRVVAIGNSLGEYQNTVTSGIISGVGRPVSAQAADDTVETLTDLLQTDAAINPGNSGGPLVNLSGQVIGINTAVAADAQSIGFSIPINSTKGLIKNIEKTGKVQRAFLGVNYMTITPELTKRFNLPVKKGSYIIAENGQSVVSGSPADKAGLKDKDIITKVGGIEIGERGSVGSLVSEYTIGDKVDLTVLRNGKEITLTATLEAYTQL